MKLVEMAHRLKPAMIAATSPSPPCINAESGSPPPIPPPMPPPPPRPRATASHERNMTRGAVEPNTMALRILSISPARYEQITGTRSWYTRARNTTGTVAGAVSHPQSAVVSPLEQRPNTMRPNNPNNVRVNT